MLKVVASVSLVAVGILLIVAVDSEHQGDQNEVTGSDLIEIGPSTRKPLNELPSEDGNEDVEEQQHQEDQNEATESDLKEIVPTRKPLKELPPEDGDEDATDQRIPKCGLPPDIEGTITPRLQGTEHAVGTIVSYQCNFGYVARGSDGFLSTCKIDESTGVAEWTHPDITCVSRSCGDPGYIANGRRVGNLFTFPNKVEFECHQGYRLSGLKVRYCQTSGEWSGRLPSCIEVYCPPPPVLENGRVRFSSLEYGTELKYECNNGFVLVNHQTRYCTSNGTWSNEEPQCIEARCKMPVSPERGSVQFFGEPKAGSLAMYSCDEGTTMVGASTSKCLSTGDWTFDAPKCLSSCKITDVKDGAIGRYESIRVSRSKVSEQFVQIKVGESVQHSETVTLLCKSGFTPANSSKVSADGSDTVLCSNGSWNKPMLCEEMLCRGDPPPVENGDPVIKFRHHGWVIWYKCHDPDYDKGKSGRVECVHGTWKGPTPTCIDTRCYTDELNYPGLVKPQQRIFPSRENFEIVCAKGYRKIVRQKNIRCFKGKWDIDKNPCEIVTCDDGPPETRNGKPLPFTREHNSEVHYECDEGFDMMNNSTVRCEDGKWEGDPPLCQKLRIETSHLTSVISSEDVSPKPLTSSSRPTQVCSCGYDYRTDLVTATVGEKVLNPGEKVDKGQVVTFRCLYSGMDLMWPSGLRFFSSVNLTCDACREWHYNELPYCDTGKSGDSLIMYDNKMRIQPGGFVEVKAKDDVLIRCLNNWAQPGWYIGSGGTGIELTGMHKDGFFYVYMHIPTVGREHAGRYDCFAADHYGAFRATILSLNVVEPEIQCPELLTETRRGNFIIEYENDRKVNSEAYYTCKDKTQKLIGTNSRRCLEDGKWSGSFPSCEDMTCTKYPTYNGLKVSYTNKNKVNSTAKFRCPHPSTLIGSNSSVCQRNGTWSKPWPICEVRDILCPVIDHKGVFTVKYSSSRRINSTAQFFCLEDFQKVEGCSVWTCQQNGEWSGTYPTCIDYISCSSFEVSQDLEVSYSDSVRVGSTAAFYCSPPMKLIGPSSAECLPNGTWSRRSPVCEIPKCSIFSLGSSLPEGVVPDVNDETEEFVPYGTDIPLMCEENLIRTGSPKATCQLSDSWNYGNVQCVPGCLLNKDTSSHLLIEPVKEGYRFGEFILLSCPPGLKPTNEVQRVMCMGKSWSDDLPDCIEITETSPSGVKETTRKSS